MDRPLRNDHTQRNQLWHIKGSGGAAWFTYTYDAAGNMTRRHGTIVSAADSLNASYDELNRVETWENTGANDLSFARSRYTYDNLSRERSVSRDEEGGYGDSFGYNDRNQLTSASYSVAVATPTPTPTPTPPPPTPTPTPPPPTPTPTPPPGKVSPVNFNPNSFTNRASPPSPLTVYLGTQTAGAVIYYTHNGTTPVPGNGTLGRVLPSEGIVLLSPKAILTDKVAPVARDPGGTVHGTATFGNEIYERVGNAWQYRGRATTEFTHTYDRNANGVWRVDSQISSP